MSPCWTLYIVPKPPTGCEDLEMVRDRMWVTIDHWLGVAYGLSIGTNLNDLEWPWTEKEPLFCVFSPNSIALQADYLTVVENRPIISVKYCLPVPVFQFWPKLTHPAVQSLYDNWASCSFQIDNILEYCPGLIFCLAAERQCLFLTRWCAAVAGQSNLWVSESASQLQRLGFPGVLAGVTARGHHLGASKEKKGRLVILNSQF